MRFRGCGEPFRFNQDPNFSDILLRPRPRDVVATVSKLRRFDDNPVLNEVSWGFLRRRFEAIYRLSAHGSACWTYLGWIFGCRSGANGRVEDYMYKIHQR